jgi:hypothetical protein
MSSDLRGSVKLALRVTGVAGIVLSLATLPTVWGTVTGHANSAAYLYEFSWGLPSWARWQDISAAGVGLVLVGAICTLLIVSGRWPSRVLAVVTLGIFIYSKAAFVGTSYWRNWMALSGDATPASLAVTAAGGALLAVSITALVISSRVGSPTGEMSG